LQDPRYLLFDTGIRSSVTTNIIAPAANPSAYGSMPVKTVTIKAPSTPENDFNNPMIIAHKRNSSILKVLPHKMAAKQPRPQEGFVCRFQARGKKDAAIFPVLATEPNATPTARPLRDIMDHDSEKKQPVLIPTRFLIPQHPLLDSQGANVV